MKEILLQCSERYTGGCNFHMVLRPEDYQGRPGNQVAESIMSAFLGHRHGGRFILTDSEDERTAIDLVPSNECREYIVNLLEIIKK